MPAWSESDPRGELPHFFPCSAADAERWGGFDGIPGVRRVESGVVCVADIAPDIAAWTGSTWTPPPVPRLSERSRARLTRLGLWPHQIEGDDTLHGGAHWIMTHAQGVLSDPTRAGKTGQCIGAAIARDFQRVLIVAVLPAARGVWARQIEQFTEKDTGKPDQILMLYGRACERARWWGTRRYLRGDDLQVALRSARWVICNPEILHEHVTTNRRGVIGKVESLPGWQETLAALRWDIAFVDEIHRASGWREGDGANKRVAMKQTLRNVPRCWAITATPARGGMVRHLWGVLDLVSNGGWDEEPWRFLKRYCAAKHVERQIGKDRTIRVWDDTGRDKVAELAARLKRYCIRRPRSVYAPFMPRKIQEIVWLEREAEALAGYVTEAFAAGAAGDVPGLKATQSLLMNADLKVTLPAMLERASEEVAAGEKIYILVDRLVSCKEVVTKIQKHKTMKHVPLFVLTGKVAQDDRDALAQQFVKTKGAAIVVAVIAAVPGAISLRGVVQEHWLEVSHDPVDNQQAGDRPYEPGITRGLTLTYWAVRNSVGQHRLELLLPKIETLSRLQDEDDIQGLADAMKDRGSEAETLVDVWARLEKSLTVEEE